MPQLDIKWGSREYRFAFEDSGVDIGRSDDNLLQIKDVKISRYQCKIVKTPMGFLLSDTDSSNGTFLNGKKIERSLLKNNDAIKIGHISLIFSEPSARPANGGFNTAGRMVISSGNSLDDPSTGEITTVVNIQPEPVIQGAVSVHNGNCQKVAAVPVMMARVVKPAAPANVRQAPKAMNNNVSVNGAGRPPLKPAHQPTTKTRIVAAQPAPVRNMAAQAMPRPAIPEPGIPQPPAVKPQIVLRPAVPASGMAPLSVAKPQTGLISRLAQPPINNSAKPSRVSAIKPSRSASAVIRPSIPGRPSDKQDNAGMPRPKKNKNMFYFIGAGAALLLVIIIFIASAGSDKKVEDNRKRENKMLQQAEKLYGAKDYKEALKRYEEFLTEFKSSKNAAGVQDRIKKIKARESKDKEAKPKLAALKRKKKDYSPSQYPGLLKEFDEFIREYSDVSPEVIQEAKDERDGVKRIAASAQSSETDKRYTETMAEAANLKDKKDYDGALAKLKLFLKENRSLNDRQENAMKSEIKAIEKEKSEKSEKK
jgi:hypothetical protein